MNIAEIPSTPATDLRWKRKVVMTKTSNKEFVLHDHSDGLYVPDSAQPSLKVAEVPFHENASPAQPDVGVPVRAVTHITGTRQDFETGLFPATISKETTGGRHVIALQVSRTGSVDTPSAATEAFVWLSMKSREAYTKVAKWLPEFLELDFETAKALAEIAKGGDRAKAYAYETKFAHFLDIILPGRVENLLAFRLLCEACKYKKAEGKIEFEGIEIHAPKGIGQWLAPFGKEVSQNANENAKAIDEVAGMVGSGDIKTKAKAVLEAVPGNADKLAKAIDDFLKELAKASA